MLQAHAIDQIRELDRRWAEAETAGDVAALDALATADFTLVGPAGFLLDKEQWLDRHRHGDLATSSLRFEAGSTRIHGATAITIGRHQLEAEYRGRPASGEFRATHIAVRNGDQWQLAGLHLSPIAGPPPLAQQREGIGR